MQAIQPTTPTGVPSSNTNSTTTAFLHLPAPVKGPDLHNSIVLDTTATDLLPPSHPQKLSNTVLSDGDSQVRTETDEKVIPTKTITQQPPLNFDVSHD